MENQEDAMHTNDTADDGQRMDPVFITGGTGFVGGNVVKALGDRPVRRLVRSRTANPPSPNTSDTMGDVTDPSSFHGAMDGYPVLIHLVAVIEESGEQTFDRVIRGGTEHVVDEAKRSGVKHIVHMSALGAQDNPQYPYHQAKYRSEQIVKESGIDYTIFRPSIIFGSGDGFISLLAQLVKLAPLTPVIGDGSARFQPVAIQDVADSFLRAVSDPETTRNQIYELGGARPYTYVEMLDVIRREQGVRRPKVHLPLGLMKSVVRLSSPLPRMLRPPVTMDQLKMLSIDNSTEDSATAKLIGRTPVALEDGIGYIRT